MEGLRKSFAAVCGLLVVAVIYLMLVPTPVNAQCCKECGRCYSGCTTRYGCQSPLTCVVYNCYTLVAGAHLCGTQTTDSCTGGQTCTSYNVDVCGFPSECNGGNQCPDHGN
jgi:hypothetical protein